MNGATTTPTFEPETALEAMLYVANKLNEQGISADFHRLFTILYFADREHFAK
jgi:hypothetical protein